MIKTLSDDQTSPDKLLIRDNDGESQKLLLVAPENGPKRQASKYR